MSGEFENFFFLHSQLLLSNLEQMCIVAIWSKLGIKRNFFIITRGKLYFADGKKPK